MSTREGWNKAARTAARLLLLSACLTFHSAWARDTNLPPPVTLTEPDEAELATHGHYTNKDGTLVHSPAKTVDGNMPAGSHHGGVATWMN
jgi:hypothetical protein